MEESSKIWVQGFTDKKRQMGLRLLIGNWNLGSTRPFRIHTNKVVHVEDLPNNM